MQAAQNLQLNVHPQNIPLGSVDWSTCKEDSRRHAVAKICPRWEHCARDPYMTEVQLLEHAHLGK